MKRKTDWCVIARRMIEIRNKDTNSLFSSTFNIEYIAVSASGIANVKTETEFIVFSMNMGIKPEISEVSSAAS